ncbi:MAG: transporter substrate-binding domain-containing protein [Bacteroidales bacterium]|nr:transporter substrate-binding domain-containing protein [Bacteroidales bacterium]
MKKVSSMRLLPVALVTLIGASTLTVACGSKSADDHQLPDTLRVSTIYGPASYFYYRDTIMGYDYDMIEELAAEHGFVVDWRVAGSLDEAIQWAVDGEVDLVGTQIPVTADSRHKIIPCGLKTYTEEVLVQPPGDTVLVDINQLKGQTVYVQKDSKSEEALEEVNDKIGGGINIRPVDEDSLATEDMLAAVAHGDIHLAIVDSETAKLNKTYYPDLNITLAISTPELSQWGVAKDMKWLGEKIDEWMKEAKPREAQDEILKKYFDSQKNLPVEGASFDRKFENGYASPFDHLYKQHTEGTSWDWRLLAAQGFTESRFDSTARSWAGAKGVMQIMPNTAKDFGLKKSEMSSASRSIETAVKVLNRYDEILASKVPDPIERQKFVMAAYNAGPGHVLDAIALAKKYKLDPTKWDGNVEKAMLMKMKRKYYRDPVVKYGYSRGRETVDYVKRIWNYYDEVRKKIPA